MLSFGPEYLPLWGMHLKVQLPNTQNVKKRCKTQGYPCVFVMDTKEKVENVLKKIRPGLQADGGDIELIEVKGDVAKIRLKGACAGCPMSQMTLKFFVESSIKKEVPEIKAVESV